MSGSLSGQLDWVSLSKSTFTFGLDVLVRLSKAELHPATIAVGLIACNQFKRIYDALSSLKSFSSYGKLSVIKDLADTEHGMVCVALCACMSISYDSFYAAGVLRELCKIRGTPPDFLPSVHQWKALVDICAGSVSNSKFPILLEGLIRCVLPNAEVLLHEPTSTEALARAVGALADVSNGKLENVTIAGGLDCVWLAAISEWLLSLDVEIRHSPGPVVYKSPRNDDCEFPAVTIIFVSGTEQPIYLSKCHIVPKGHKFWDTPSLEQHTFRGGRSEWTSILADTFGPRLNTLIQGSTRQEFALLLFNVSCLTEAYYRYGLTQGNPQQNFTKCSGPFGRFHFSHSYSRGQAFLGFAAQRLPELAEIVDTVKQLEIRPHINANLEDCINSISLKCGCQRCRGQKIADNCYSPDFCLELMAETIQERWKRALPAYLAINGIDTLTAALIIFSGSIDIEPIEDEESSAVSRHGVCAFFGALEDLDSLPEEASTVKVVPGHIDFEGIKYGRICDPVDDVRIPKGDFGPHPSYKLLVQETRRPGVIAAAYKLSCNIQSYGYLLGISRLESAIAKSIRGPIRCGEFCGRRFPYSARETIVVVPKGTIQEGNLSDQSEEPPPFLRQWSLLSLPSPGMDEAIKLRVVQASICRLYFEIAQQDDNYHLAFLSVCRDCPFKLSHPLEFGKEAMSLSPKLCAFSHSGSEGSITVSSPSETGSWMDRAFEIFVVTRSSHDAQGISVIDAQNAMQSLPKLFHTAATLGREGMVQLLLQGGAIVNSTTVGGETALHCAAKEGQNEVVKMLLRRGAQLEVKDKDSLTPLSRVARSGHIAMADVNAAAGYSGRTALQAAAEGGHLAVVKRLLQEKADWKNSTTGSGRRRPSCSS
ncbi:putative ankyrin repeat-containing protein [Cenococcum geophilum]